MRPVTDLQRSVAPFEVVTDMVPAGDQPQAIAEMEKRIRSGAEDTVLLGATGTGKTATVAWLAERLQRPVLVMLPNKTLAAQFANELREMLPRNAVEYFVSYYDYYQPEAYVPQTDTYIEKDSSINDEVERLRHSATNSLLTRRDTIVVASVSCIYGLGTPQEYVDRMLKLNVGGTIDRDALLRRLVGMQYVRNDLSFTRGTFRVRGDTIEIIPVYEEMAVRIEMFGDEIERLMTLHPLTGEVISEDTELYIFPASHYVAGPERMERAINGIEDELAHRLGELERLATGPLAESFADAYRNPPVFDPATHSVRIPESLRKSYRAFMDAEWYRLFLPAELGGTQAPHSLNWAMAELILGSNPAIWMYASGHSMGRALWQLGTDEQKRFAQQAIDREWGGTMVLTEPDAGSDVGAGRTKAIAQPDGTWHIEGVKRFITSAEHDLAENIFHLVLARPEGHGPGTKGLSMFLVPKYLVNEDGTLGERNGVVATNVEHKMGLKASTTCELTFGAVQPGGRPAVGTLVGGVHDGIRQMFKIIEEARMMVGTKAIATLSTGYLNALDFARNRVQGADLTRQADKTAPRVTIIHHPDVRRMLMLQKAYAEGLRALYMYAAAYSY